MRQPRAIKPVPQAPVDAPAPFNVAVASAIQAFSRGEATEQQQVLAYEWIVKQAASIGGQSFRGGDSHATAFMEGRRFVAAQMIALQAIDIEKLRRTTDNG